MKCSLLSMGITLKTFLCQDLLVLEEQEVSAPSMLLPYVSTALCLHSTLLLRCPRARPFQWIPFPGPAWPEPSRASLGFSMQQAIKIAERPIKWPQPA